MLDLAVQFIKDLQEQVEVTLKGEERSIPFISVKKKKKNQD